MAFRPGQAKGPSVRRDQTGGGGEINTGANVGTGAGLSFRDKTGVTLNFRSVDGTGGIVTSVNGDNVEIDGSAAGTGEANLGANVGTGAGLVFRDKTGVTLNIRSIDGTGGIVASVNGNNVEIDGSGITGADTIAFSYGLSNAVISAGPFHMQPFVSERNNSTVSSYVTFPMGIGGPGVSTITGMNIVAGEGTGVIATSVDFELYSFPIDNVLQRAINAGTFLACLNLAIPNTTPLFYRNTSTGPISVAIPAGELVFAQVGPISFLNTFNDLILTVGFQ